MCILPESNRPAFGPRGADALFEESIVSGMHLLITPLVSGPMQLCGEEEPFVILPGE
jgi:hypothetical protein